jgi:DNA-binding response OmpR family regulator
VRALLRAALEPAGSRIVAAGDGSEAVDLAWRERPDLVLLDVALPKLSGIDACRAMKTNPDPPRVLLVTGNPEAIDPADCGADGVIPKPLPMHQLFEIVTAELAKRHDAASTSRLT